MTNLKEIIIRFKTCSEYIETNKRNRDDKSIIEVLIDGEPIERLERFSIDLYTDEFKPSYTIQQYADYPKEKEYCEQK